jgi:hypothetical protein
MKINIAVGTFLLAIILGIQCPYAQEDIVDDKDPNISIAPFMVTNTDSSLNFGILDYIDADVIVIDDHKYFLSKNSQIFSNKGSLLPSSVLSIGNLVGFERDSSGKINQIFILGEPK